MAKRVTDADFVESNAAARPVEIQTAPLPIIPMATPNALFAILNDARAELKTISKDIVEAKTTFKILKWVIGIVGVATIGLLGYLADIGKAAAQHYLGW